jgi:hypothetical protein
MLLGIIHLIQRPFEDGGEIDASSFTLVFLQACRGALLACSQCRPGSQLGKHRIDFRYFHAHPPITFSDVCKIASRVEGPLAEKGKKPASFPGIEPPPQGHNAAYSPRCAKPILNMTNNRPELVIRAEAAGDAPWR